MKSFDPVKFQQDYDHLTEFMNNPRKGLKLSEEQIKYLDRNGIYVCTAYIGMVRLYYSNRTIFQTSAIAPIFDSLFAQENDSGLTNVYDYESLTIQVHRFINALMGAPKDIQKKIYENNLPLFASGELEQIE